MIYPPNLRPGDTIGVFSPSYPLGSKAPEVTQLAISHLEANGYKVKLGKLIDKADGYRSGSILDRANEFNSLVADDSVQCIMAAVGGMVSNSILPYIHYAQLQKAPKTIIGHSDVTAILLGIYQMTGIVTYYGPNLITTLGQYPPFLESTNQCLKDILGGYSVPYAYAMPSFFSDELTNWEEGATHKTPIPNKWITVKGGKAIGRLIGGNLNTITGIYGSKYMPEICRGDILFLEDTEKDVSHAERYFSWLKICGIFDKIGGLILGKHRKFDDRGTGKKPYQVLEEIIGPPHFPILADFDCCHTVPMLTLPIGKTVELDADLQAVRLLE
ncbi:MAG TPA: LD-carboxypeptidase [Firmicutes bacterium]|nr:LD-carboxypeptidase [Bacillota bacterium]